METPDASDLPAARRARGAYFTPPQLVDFIVRWAVRSPDDPVLEPSCGDARFLRSAGGRQRELAEPQRGSIQAGSLDGIELHRSSADDAREALTAAGLPGAIEQGNFFDLNPKPHYRAVIGNPPFLRFQEFGGTVRASALRQSLAAGVRLDGRSNAWAYFVVHAARFVSPGGRLGLVLPADLLHAGYAAEVRSFLLRRFADVRVLTFRKRVFPDANVNVVVLLAEGEGPASHFKMFEADGLGDDLKSVLEQDWNSSTLVDAQSWSSALVEPRVLESYELVAESKQFSTLGATWGKTSIGAVAGDAHFFRMTQERLHELQLAPEDVIRIFPGWRGKSDIFFTKEDWESARKSSEKVFLFYPHRLSTAARDYIIQAEEAARTSERPIANRSGKCAARVPWWRVPLEPIADLFVANISHHSPIFMSNSAQVRHTNSYYGIALDDGVRELGRSLLPIGALNTVTLLGTELLGRSHGNGGLKMSVADVDGWPVPTPGHLAELESQLNAVQPRVRQLVRRQKVLDAASVVDQILFPSGLADGLATMQHELTRLRDRRVGRSAL